MYEHFGDQKIPKKGEKTGRSMERRGGEVPAAVHNPEAPGPRQKLACVPHGLVSVLHRKSEISDSTSMGNGQQLPGRWQRGVHMLVLSLTSDFSCGRQANPHGTQASLWEDWRCPPLCTPLEVAPGAPKVGSFAQIRLCPAWSRPGSRSARNYDSSRVVSPRGESTVLLLSVFPMQL